MRTENCDILRGQVTLFRDTTLKKGVYCPLITVDHKCKGAIGTEGALVSCKQLKGSLIRKLKRIVKHH